MKLFAVLALAVVAVTARSVNDEPKNWAVLVAGSNGWYNYRHQADICHAYQIMIKNGIPPERIITLMYDDIAHNRENPTPGIIINRPDGPDVYHGVAIDYTKHEVNPDNFLKVLRGDKEGMQGIGTGRVLESGPNDHVFVNFADHGAPGLIAFGNRFLHATDLHTAVMYMNQQKLYNKMVFYIEACESGSMFIDNLLPKNIHVYATTAANPEESSYACYMDQKRGTYLGDVYSVKWMEDSDKEDISTETLKVQYEIVRKETNTSHVMQYGNLTMNGLHVGAFQGKDKMGIFDMGKLPNPNKDAVPSEDVPLNILQMKYKMAAPEDKQAARDALIEFKEYRQRTMETFKHIVAISVNDDKDRLFDVMNQRRRLTSYTCYETAVEHLLKNCPRLNLAQNDFGLRHLYTLVNLCQQPIAIETIIDAMYKVADNTDLCY